MPNSSASASTTRQREGGTAGSFITPALLDALASALAEVLTFSAPADAVLKRFFREHPRLGPQQRAFVAEGVYGTLRRKRLLESLVPGAGARRLALAALIRVQSYSVRELVPALRNGEADWLQTLKAEPPVPSDLGVAADLPDMVIERLRPQMDDSEILALGRALQRPAPLDLRVNPMLAERDVVLAELIAMGLKAAPTPYSPLGIRLREKPAINRTDLFLQGKIEVQDEGSQLVGFLVAPRRREMVVDLCAGAGGKTLLLGALMANQGRLYAFDVSQPRLDNLGPRLKRSGLSNVHPVRISDEHDTRVKRLAGKIDRVLVDAPCSGLGTLRRNPDLKWRQTENDIGELVAKQNGILDAAATLPKVGGRVVYATCSLLPEENDGVVQTFLGSHANYRLVPAGEVMAAQRLTQTAGDVLRLYPHRHDTDGFFAAVFERIS